MLGLAYSDSEGEDIPTPLVPSRTLVKVQAAPTVALRDIVQQYESPLSKTVYHNAEYDAMWAPVVGPSHPVFSRETAAGRTGHAEEHHLNDSIFQKEFNSYNNQGVASNPSINGGVVQSARRLMEQEQQATEEPQAPKAKNKRNFGDASDLENFRGPWAPFQEELELNETLQQNALNEEQVKELQEHSKKVKVVEAPPEFKIKSIFHGDSEQLKDYMGRSFVDPPTSLKNNEHECFLPKKQLHTWKGHSKAVNAIRFFPKYGHLLLSAGSDSLVKIWDVYGKQKCVRTYIGHQQAVRDICFSNDGRKFLTASYDKNINYWDTETGQCLGTYTNHRVPYCVKFNPDDNRQNIFLAGCSNKKVVQVSLQKISMTEMSSSI